MLIRYASDLHLERAINRSMEDLNQQFLPLHENDYKSILVLAGDISSSQIQLLQFLKYQDKRFYKVLYIPGNHEYYNQDYHNWNTWLNITLPLETKNTIWAAGEVKLFETEDCSFVLGTLWGDGGKNISDAWQVDQGLNDFKLIQYSTGKFKVPDMQYLNQLQVKDIDNKLLKLNLLFKPFKKIVVITHHLPSYDLCHPRFGTSLNGGFACSAEHLICLADYWIFGHTHDTIERQIEGCKMVSNPCGYKTETNRSQYNDYGIKFLEV